MYPWLYSCQLQRGVGSQEHVIGFLPCSLHCCSGPCSLHIFSRARSLGWKGCKETSRGRGNLEEANLRTVVNVWPICWMSCLILFSSNIGKVENLPHDARKSLPYIISYKISLSLLLGATLILSRASSNTLSHFRLVSWHSLAIVFFWVWSILSFFPIDCGFHEAGSFHSICKALLTCWLTSETKDGLLSLCKDDRNPYLGLISLRRSCTTSVAFSVLAGNFYPAWKGINQS